jgi:hypothetical protein
MSAFAGMRTCGHQSKNSNQRRQRPDRNRAVPVTIEPLEPRQLLTSNTIQVQITPAITTVTGMDLQNLGVNFQLKDLTGTLTVTGDLLSAQTVGNHISLAGNLRQIDDISLSNTTPASSLVVKGPSTGLHLDAFESTGPMKMIDVRPLVVDGQVNLVAAPSVQFGDSSTGGVLNIIQNIPVVKFSGNNFSNSQLNFTADPAITMPMLTMKFNNFSDTHLSAGMSYINSLNLNSATESTAGGSGITANSMGAFKVTSDYKADLNFAPSFGLKYTLDNYKIGGTGSGNWNIPGATRLGSAGFYDSGYNATFGSLGTYSVGKDFTGGHLTAGSIGNASVGHDLVGGTWSLTNPYNANSWNLWNLHVGDSISGSTIKSDGNLGNLSTMFTYNSNITAGLNPSYVFGQPITNSTYTSWSWIKSFTSDCPSHHKIHFVSSYVGAYDFGNIHLGNIQTANNGLPFGVGGFRIDKMLILDNGKQLTFNSLNSSASFDSGLQPYGLTQQSLSDFKVMFPN